MLHVYKRLLLLAVLLTTLAWVTRNSEAQSAACQGCTNTYTSCQAACNGNASCLNNCHNSFVNCQSVNCQNAAQCENCSNVYFGCLGGCEQARQDCIAQGNFGCNETASSCNSGCDGSYSSCRNQHCGGGGGGGVGCNGSTTGYSRSCVDVYRSSRDQCLAGGSSGATYLSCMNNYNDQAYCCEQQFNSDVQQECQCTIDSRNPDCACNP